jgi:hypothetical protein
MSSGYIDITRADGYWADRLRAYKIYIDKSFRSTIRAGGSQRIEVEPGHHTVRMRIDYCRSRPLDVEVGQGQVVILRCWPNVRAYNWPFFATLGCSHYIALRNQTVEVNA